MPWSLPREGAEAQGLAGRRRRPEPDRLGPGRVGVVGVRERPRARQAARPEGAARLRWACVPGPGTNGNVTLTLKVTAELAAIQRGEAVEEPEVEIIDVQAVQ